MMGNEDVSVGVWVCEREREEKRNRKRGREKNNAMAIFEDKGEKERKKNGGWVAFSFAAFLIGIF